MLDRRKTLLLATIGIGLIAVIIVLIIMLTTQANNRTDSSTPPTEQTSSTPTPSATPGSGAQAAIDLFNKKYTSKVQNAALVATSWNQLEDPAITKAKYLKVGFSEELASQYKPVWANILQDAVGSQFSTTIPSDKQISISEVSGEPGSYVWRIAIKLTFTGDWNINNMSHAVGARSDTWWFTFDQRTETITAIDQPSPADLQINVYGE